MSNAKLAGLPTIKRLPSYLHIVEGAAQDGHEYISGTVIAEELGLEPIQVRKDLAITGIVGKPRLGFPVRALIDAINSFLRWNVTTYAIVMGAGSLGTALMGYAEFPRHGLHIVAAFDPDSSKVGTSVRGTPIHDVSRLSAVVRDLGVTVAILTVPNGHAQTVAEELVDAGIHAIWNFTNVKIKVPEHVIVQKEDLSSGYAVLSVKMGLHAENTADSRPITGAESSSTGSSNDGRGI